MKHQIRIRRDGFIECLGELPFKTENKTRTRFSEIVPVNLFLFVAFRIIRAVFGEGRGRIPEWTRNWVCLWRCTILLGKHAGESRESGIRDSLVQWEKEKWFSPKFDL